MRREDIANFLTAERRISPLTAFSLLITAGFIAGSLQLVAPQTQVMTVNQEQPQPYERVAISESVNPVAMTAAASAEDGEEPVTSTFSSDGKPFDPKDAPSSCVKAIQAALNKKEGPVVKQVDKGQSGKMDFCFGAVLKDGKQPSNKPEDYQCVGRSGTVMIDAKAGTATTETKPDKEATQGQCKVKVCQTYPIPGTSAFTSPQCSEPKKFGAGQNGNAKSGGLPPLPQMPQSPQSPPSATPPQPTPPQPDQQPKPDPTRGPDTSTMCTNPEMGPCTNKPPETKPDEPFKIDDVPDSERKFPMLCGNGQPCDAPAKLGPNGAVVPAADGQTLVTPNPKDPEWIDPNLTDGKRREDFNRTTTFGEPDPAARVKQPEEPKGIFAQAGDYIKGKWEGVKTFFGYPESANCGENCTQIPRNTGTSNRELGNPCETNPENCTTVPRNVPPPQQPPAPPQLPPAPPQQPPAPPQQPPAPPQQPPAPPQQPPTTIPDQQTAPRPSTGGGLGSLFGGGGGGAGGLMSFLGGLMKGLGVGQPAAPQQAPASTCPTDPNAYAQYQQQYNYQLQQYNYQLQQYNYQVQNNQAYGYTNSIVPPVAPTPCRPGYGSGGGEQCPILPPQPTPTTCPTGTWRQMTESRVGMVCPMWQCVPNNATTPTAQIACSPDVAEKGTRVTVSFTCTNAQRSTGFGFDTKNQTSGAETITIDPPDNASAANYAVRCEDGAISASAQCSVQIAKVSISLRASPDPVTAGESGLIGWVTTGMKSCVVSSPDQDDFTIRNAGRTATAGIATTSPMTQASDFYLDCVTVTGENRHEEITLGVYHPGTVSSSIDNRTDVIRGSTATIRWSFHDAPELSAVALWLYNVGEQKTVALITGHRAKTGVYTWDIPTDENECNMSSSIVCGSDLVPGVTYAIFASLYQPVNANLGEYQDSSLPKPKFLDNPISAAFKVVQ